MINQRCKFYEPVIMNPQNYNTFLYLTLTFTSCDISKVLEEAKTSPHRPSRQKYV